MFDNVVLDTPRLILRVPEAADAAAVYRMYSDPRVARYLSHPPWTDIAQAVAWVGRMQEQLAAGSGLQLLLQRRDDQAVIGTCCLFHPHVESRRAEIGYALSSPFWGHGYIHEALQALLEHAFGHLGLRRIEADIDPRNAASARVLRRLGFTHEGCLRERWEVAGEISDTVYYGLLRREWHGDRESGPAG